MSTPKYDVVVVGGGASGLMAAGRAAVLGARVLLLEKNKKVGQKLAISGGGRCNITNNEPDLRALLKSYGKAEQFLYSSFSQFGVKDAFVFFESIGVPLAVEAHKRAFPATRRAPDVVAALERYVRKAGVDVRTGSPVKEVLTEDGKISAVVCGTERIAAQAFIFATGGVSHPETGSSGDGFEWLTKLGHSVVSPTPTIVPLRVTEQWVHRLAGITLPGVKITFFVDGTKAFTKAGKVLCTHFGISGPLILNTAHMVADLLHGGVVTAAIDLSPAEDLGTLESRVVALFDAHKNKVLKNVLKHLVPEGAAKGIVLLLPVIAEKKVHSVTKEERKILVRLLKALPLTVEGLMGFDRAVIADGGVPLDEIDTKTLRSKMVSNLFVTGDLLHINRPSGGFSLQLCWTTGWVAGNTASTALS
jgi:predicted Rossmann fold flavoprotein